MDDGTGKSPAPPWAFEPWVAWLYLVLAIALALTPLWPLGWVVAVVACVFTYQDCKARGRPGGWWTFCVFLIGPIGYLIYVYQRRKQVRLEVKAPPAPHEAPGAAYAPSLPPPPLPSAPQPPAPLPPPPPVQPVPPADWYPDPGGSARLRYWDGTAWTDHTAD